MSEFFYSIQRFRYEVRNFKLRINKISNMKKTLLLSWMLTLLGLGGIQAQITFEATDIPVIGDVLIFANDTLPTQGPGTDGAGQSWDFSGIGNDVNFVVDNVDPATTPYAAVFPDADLCQIVDTDVFVFFKNDPSFQDVIGIGADAGPPLGVTGIRMNDFQRNFEFPVTSTSSFSDDYSFSVTIDGTDFDVDSVRLTRTGTRTVDVVGDGTILTPNSTTPYNTLKLNIVDTYNDVIEVLFFGFWTEVDNTSSTDQTYTWLAKETKGTVLSMGIDQATGNPISIAYYWEPMIPAPDAAFTYTEDAVPGVINFMDNSTGDIDDYLWDFGDGNTSTDMDPQHFFEEPGDYEVCLTVSNVVGEDTYCETVTIVFPPQSLWNADFPTPLNVDFTDESLYDPTSWTWTFGDGNVSTVQNPSHTYASPGTYEVCLVVSNAEGTDTECMEIEVYGTLNAAFTYAFVTDVEVDFTDITTGNWETITWDLGDGSTATDLPNYTHTYAASDMYNVCLTATNPFGSDTDCQMVNVVMSSLNEVLDDVELVLYPNPASETVYLDIQENGNFQVALTNMLGQNIRNYGGLNSGINHLDISDIPAGQYIVTVVEKDSGDTTVTKMTIRP